MRTLIRFIGRYSLTVRWLYWRLSNHEYLWELFMFLRDTTLYHDKFKVSPPGERSTEAEDWIDKHIDEILR